ncbi:hypothetical protein DV515_00002497, partial [Chloebia gouldiae]
NEKGERAFQREAFRKSVASKSIRRFLEVFMESQMFAGFIQDRELRKCRAKGRGGCLPCGADFTVPLRSRGLWQCTSIPVRSPGKRKRIPKILPGARAGAVRGDRGLSRSRLTPSPSPSAAGLFEQRVEQYLEELPDTEQSGVNKFLRGLGNKMKFLHKKN